MVTVLRNFILNTGDISNLNNYQCCIGSACSIAPKSVHSDYPSCHIWEYTYSQFWIDLHRKNLQLSSAINT